jgi:anti-sigma factor RsiW
MKMSIADDRLEILMGQLLDGEISPAERRLLESELEHNGEARELLEQLRTLHECGREAIADEALRRGADPEVVFGQAWQQHRKSFWRRVAGADGHLHGGARTLFAMLGEPRFVVGLAAGLILGLGLHFVLVWGAKTSAVETMGPVARDVRVGTDVWDQTRLGDGPDEAGQITRNVDWYGFTDRDGNRWLVQGVREGAAKPVAYRSDF